MLFLERIRILLDLQKLTGAQSKTIYDLVKLGLIESKKIGELINEMVKERFKKGKAYIEFASKLNINSPEEQTHIVSRNYYGIYHLARAVVFHTSRTDVKDHKPLSDEFTKIVKLDKTKAEFIAEKLAKWREIRNNVDYEPYLPYDIVKICEESNSDARKILDICEQYLKERGVNFETV
jgi:uncharacterized protein (UPF0332 family)